MRRMKHLWSRLVIYAPSKEELDLDERTSQVKVGTQKSAGRNKRAPLTAPRSLGFKRVSGKLMECLKIQWPDLFCLKGGGRNMADRNISRASASRWSFCFKPHHFFNNLVLFRSRASYGSSRGPVAVLNAQRK